MYILGGRLCTSEVSYTSSFPFSMIIKSLKIKKKRQQFAKNCITENYKIKLSMLYVLNTEVITENPVYLKYTAWLLGNEGKLCTMYKQINVYENEIWDTWPIKWNIWNEISKIFIKNSKKILTSATFSPPAAILASRDVVVVPILDPRVRGYALSKLMSPAPARGVRVEVNTELDCTSTVITAPTNMYM